MSPIRRALKGFVRLETAAVLMAIVTMVVALGSLFPQLSPSVSLDVPGVTSWRAAVRARYGGWSHILLSLGAFRFSRSALFLVPSGLLLVSSVVCALNRWSGQRRRMRWIVAGDGQGRLDSAPLVGLARADSGQSTQIVRLTGWLGHQHFAVQQEMVEDDVVLLRAQRNRWAGASTLGTHLSVALLLLGALLSTFLASEERLQIPSGEALALISDQRIALRNDGFRIERHADGSPALFEAQVALLDGGQVAQRAALRVNAPLHYRGYSVYLGSYWGQPGQYGVVLLVSRNPGYVPFALGGLLMVIAITLSLYFPYSRLLARVGPGGVVALAGWPGRYDVSLGREWPHLIALLDDSVGHQQVVLDPSSEDA